MSAGKPHYTFHLAGIAVCLGLLAFTLNRFYSKYSRNQNTNEPHKAVQTNEPRKQEKIQEDSLPQIYVMDSTLAYPMLFEAAYEPGTRVKTDYGEFSFDKKQIGYINITSGKIIACDPIVLEAGEPYAHNFPKGKFPVELSLALIPNNQRVAFCRIAFSKKKVRYWEFALHQNSVQLPVGGEKVYCYGVDAATAVYLDRDVQEKAATGNYFGDIASGHMVSFDGGGNMAVFSTGFGDGCYSVYVGYDNEGKICRLLTDFALVEWWLTEKRRIVNPPVDDLLTASIPFPGNR